MKPISRRLKAALPSLIIVPAMIQLASAAIQATNTGDGNLTIVSGTNLADSIDANGALDPITNPGPYTVTIENGATLTGDAASPAVINVSVADYTVNNAGILNATVGAGIISTQSFILGNTNTVIGATHGVEAVDAATITNSGTIQGTALNGILSGDSLALTNSGTVRGEVNGVETGELATINNTGSIIGTTGSAVLGGTGLNLTSSGNITGMVGVEANGGNALISNGGSITGTGGTAIMFDAVGNNLLSLYNGGQINGDIIGTAGTLNNLDSTNGSIYGNISGIDTINVLSNGFLEIYGDVDSDLITVTSDSDLIGEGNWNTDVTLATGSRLAAMAETGNPDYDHGLLNITGNVSGSYSIYVGVDTDLQIANNGTSSSLIQTSGGTFDATSATFDFNPGSDTAIRNGEYIIVENTGGNILGGVGNPITLYGLTDTVWGNYFAESSIKNGDIVVTAEHNFSDLGGLTENQSSLGEALDIFAQNEAGLGANQSNNWQINYLISELDQNNLAYTQETLAAIVAPTEAALGVTNSVINSNYRLHRMTQDHLASARNGGETVTTTHTAPPITDSKGGMISGGETTTSTSSVGNNGNLWGTYSYDRQNHIGLGDQENFDGDAQSFTAGLDYRVAPNLILGILADGSRTDLDLLLGSPEVESIRGAIYGSYGASTGIYVDFLAGYGSHDLDLNDATSIQALTTVGYAMGDDHVKHGPFLGAEYQNIDADGFDYEGFPISVDDYSIDSLRGLVGYRVNANLGTFRPYASVAYAHEFKDDRSAVNASLVGIPFRLEGAEQGSAILVTAGTGISLSSSLVLDLGYRGEIKTDDEGTDSHGGSVGLNYAF